MDSLHDRARRWSVEPGYHDIFGNWHAAAERTLAHLISALSRGEGAPPYCPPVSAEFRQAYQGRDVYCWIPAVQLYSLRSTHNWGHGDFGDLAGFLQLASSAGAGGVALNPLHALFLERAEQASPYAPNSRLFLNPLYVNVAAIPEFPQEVSAELESEIAALRASDKVLYARAAQAKMTGIRLAYERFMKEASDERRADFQAYRQDRGELLLRFACFERLRHRYGPDWSKWPERWRNADLRNLKEFHAADRFECGLHEFAQWIADRQLQSCRDIARRLRMPIGLYLDLAVGVHPHGFDAWNAQDEFVSNVAIGAPPDEFNPAGQDWGLAPFNPHVLAAKNFEPVRQVVGSTMQYAGAIRIDHVLGLQRIYMVPNGSGAASGAYVRYPFEQLLDIVADESNRHCCIVIGEDLGTVPEGFRDTLARRGFWSCRVVLFERDQNGRYRRPETYPAEAVASFNTHDLATFRGWMQDSDLQTKRAIGVNPGETAETRAAAKAALIEAFACVVPGIPPNDFSAAAAFLGRTPSRIVTVSLEDIVGVETQVNIPGTTDQYPNWSLKLSVPLEEFARHDGWLRVGRVFAKAGRATPVS